MTIANLSSYSSSISSLFASSSTQSVLNQNNNESSDSIPAVGQGPRKPPEGGEMMAQLEQALSNMGIDLSSLSGTSSASSPSGTEDATTTTSTDSQSAMKEFMQTLMETLHEQGKPEENSSTTGNYQSDNPMLKDLNTLISKLSNGSSDSSDGTDNSGISKLQSSFDNLISSLGGTTGSASLADFLGQFASGMKDAPPAGNNVQTTA